MGNITTTADSQVYDPVTNRLLYRVNGTWRDSLVYDAAGNLDSLVSKKGGATNRWGYDWDVLNRLVTVRRNGTLIARYSYDVLGRRIVKRVYSEATGGDSAYVRFVYHGDHVAFEADSGSAGGIKIWKRYVWGMGTDDLLAVRDSSSGTAVHYYAVKDKLGSVRGLVKRDGTWQYSKRFGPYGAEVEASGADVGLRYRWTGREYDAETGFYYFRARYFEPVARRFVSEDPIGYPGSSNLYAYVSGAVLEARDPSGLLGVWADNYRGFRTFCTASGSCLGADGSITGRGPDIYIDGINAGSGGASLLSAKSIEAVHTGKLVDLVWASQKAVWHIDFQSTNSRIEAERCVRSSQVCANALTRLDALAQKFPIHVDEGDLTRVGTGDYRGGYTEPSHLGRAGPINHISILIDPNTFAEVNQGIGGIGWSYSHTLVHEAGHALGYAEGFDRGLSGSSLRTHHYDSALAWENAYRFERGLLGHGYSVRARATHSN
jgi:RHS repeat-associated protein